MSPSKPEIPLQKSNEVTATSRLQTPQAKASGSGDFGRANIRYLQHFAQLAAHDLKTPMRNMDQLLDLALEAYQRGEVQSGKQYVSAAREAIGSLQALMEELLAYARTGAGALNLQRIDVDQLLDRLEIEFGLRDLPKAGDIKRCIPGHFVHAEPILFYQLLQNLVSNALKFRHPDRIPVVCVELRAQTSGGLCLEISDNGIGFDKRFWEQICEEFHKVEGAKSFDGVGLGLSLCHMICTRHGWTIEASGHPGKGATFRVQMPCR